MTHQVICSLDTDDLKRATDTVRKLAGVVGAFKVGHALTLGPGLGVLETLRNAGAQRIFLDLKFHDIPNTVALAVREAARHGVWMMTVHNTGGSAMLSAAVEEVSAYPLESRPLLVGVSVLTSLDEQALRTELGVNRSVNEQVVALSQLAVANGLDGVVSSPHEVSSIREAIGKTPVIVTPGIRASSGPTHDQKRVANAATAIANGASYVVIGRALSESEDPIATLQELGL